MHRVIVETGLGDALVGSPVEIGGEEARHALRVKRVRAGERVELMDGRGTVASGVVDSAVEGGKKKDGMLIVRVESVRKVEKTLPRVEVWTAVAKGGRADEMVDQLAQTGAAQWRALETARSVAGAREGKVERLERIAAEASKQCGRAWTMEIAGEAATMAEGVKIAAGGRVVVCDASGEAWTTEMGRGATAIRLLIGPEGGWTEQEIAAARAAGAIVAKFGTHVMRIETAAVVACGVVMAG